MQKYFYPWLMFVGISHVLLGIVVIFVAKTPLVDPYFNHLYETFSATPHVESQALLRSIVQLFGPTVSSWGLLFCLAIHHYKKQGTVQIKQLITFALLIWFVIDCGLSLMNGIYWHLIINTLAALAILPPLILLKPEPTT